ncbi:hypothetical protein FQA39_LY01388 [Lamprigera yunnana]|nr:hypothetical protein FQA39_LY01388 [Lamprigera yunnana]
MKMGKKKRQGEPNRNTDDSSESCDENQNTSICPHINKGVDMPKLRKALSKVEFHEKCDKCNNAISSDLDMDGDYDFDLSLWMCLKCANLGCGRSWNKHALDHFNTPHSECHSLCINTMNWNVWCYTCDNEININSTKKLLDSVEYLKKHAESSRNKGKGSIVQHPTLEIIEMNNVESKDYVVPVNLLRTRGLRNLGNTCFFNSVMQCLGQTPYLLNLLEETCCKGQYFQLPGGKLNPEDANTIILKSLDGTLEEWGPLTRILAQTLKEFQNGQADVMNPHMLFSRLTHRMPQFAGGHQHDSHELLRHLLEAVREEDLRRYQAVILEKMGTIFTYIGLSRKTDPSSVEGDKKKIIKFYGQQASELLLPTEQVFRGVLVSTLRCRECRHTSQREEFFLDLSLPISEKQIPPLLRRKAEESDDKPSKHQTKKEKRAAKKKKKQKERSDMAMDSNYGDNIPNDSDSESDADVEDNIEENINKNEKGGESGYNSVKTDTNSPNEDNLDMRIDDNVNNSVIGMICPSPLPPDSLENSRTSSETNIDMGSPLCGHNSPIEDTNEDFERPESRLSFVNKNIDIKEDLEKLTLLNDTESKKINTFYNRFEENQDEEMPENRSVDVWANTMTTRYQCVEGECSVQSCLNQFTTCELLTENNKVRCDVCTKSRGGSDKKTVYTNATKQLLICSPPAVLILHLKRFQVFRFRSTKVNKFVTFPTLLDLAHFCSKRCQDLPTFEYGQNKILYALYGVVEHIGSLHGGHYVAYVKVRSPLQNQSYRWQYLPKNHKNDQSSRGAEANPDIPTGKWFYVSDSSVLEVAESKVLSAQAYLLFYERIL